MIGIQWFNSDVSNVFCGKDKAFFRYGLTLSWFSLTLFCTIRRKWKVYVPLRPNWRERPRKCQHVYTHRLTPIYASRHAYSTQRAERIFVKGWAYIRMRLSHRWDTSFSLMRQPREGKRSKRRVHRIVFQRQEESALSLGITTYKCIVFARPKGTLDTSRTSSLGPSVRFALRRTPKQAGLAKVKVPNSHST